jgi:uncharacterized membrane protein
MENKHLSHLRAMFREHAESHQMIFRSIKAQTDAKRTTTEKIADWMTSNFGSFTFLMFNVLVFLVWLLINTGQIKGVMAFDPFPFNFLTMVVSLEAIILAVFVLISQNRSMRVDDLRAETHLQINLITEREVTKIIKMLALLLEKQGIDLSNDPELHRMIRSISEEDIEKKLEKEIL